MIEDNNRSVDDTIAFLNELLEADESWMRAIVNHRPVCNRSIAYHPTLQAGEFKNKKGTFYAGMLGLINGLFGKAGEGGPIMYECDDETGEIKRFARWSPKK